MRRYGQRGAAIVEFAIVLPLFMLLVLGMLYFGMVVHDYSAINSLARESARYGAVVQDETKELDKTAKVTNYIKNNRSNVCLLYTLPDSGVVVRVVKDAAELQALNASESCIYVKLTAQRIEDNLPPLVQELVPKTLSGELKMRIE